MVNCCNRNSIILIAVLSHSDKISKRHFGLTKIPILHGLSSTFPNTTSLKILVAPPFLAMFNKFLLLSKPIVQISPGWPGDKDRYLPFPVPESNPTHPVVKQERKFAMIGHGYPNEIEGKYFVVIVLTLYRVDEKWGAISS